MSSQRLCDQDDERTRLQFHFLNSPTFSNIIAPLDEALLELSLIPPVQTDPDAANAADPAGQPHPSFTDIARHERSLANQYRLSATLSGAFYSNSPPEPLFRKSIVRVTASEFKDCAAIHTRIVEDFGSAIFCSKLRIARNGRGAVYRVLAGRGHRRVDIFWMRFTRICLCSRQTFSIVRAV